MIMVFMMDRKFFQLLAGKLASATPADVREQRERPLSITLLSNLQIPAKLRQNLACFSAIWWRFFRFHVRTQLGSRS